MTSPWAHADVRANYANRWHPLQVSNLKPVTDTRPLTLELEPLTLELKPLTLELGLLTSELINWTPARAAPLLAAEVCGNLNLRCERLP
jgi:hypothetical protein